MPLANLICPISIEKTDSNVSRTTVALVAALLACFVVTLNPVFIAIVAFDGATRAFFKPTYSRLRWVAAGIVRSFQFPTKFVKLAPKVFTARLGFGCALAAVVLHYAEFSLPAVCVAGLFLALALLDSVGDFCVGCLIYTYLVVPFYRRARPSA